MKDSVPHDATSQVATDPPPMSMVYAPLKSSARAGLANPTAARPAKMTDAVIPRVILIMLLPCALSFRLDRRSVGVLHHGSITVPPLGTAVLHTWQNHREPSAATSPLLVVGLIGGRRIASAARRLRSVVRTRRCTSPIRHSPGRFRNIPRAANTRGPSDPARARPGGIRDRPLLGVIVPVTDPRHGAHLHKSTICFLVASASASLVA
jgi:hypothetical protein